ncbi:putative N-acetyltransferase p20-like [Cocos nucifera]|nr:putative N-acetyltransferase p20-like [Cocos nucifera]
MERGTTPQLKQLVEEEQKPIPDITLRQLKHSDVEDLMKWKSDDRVMRFTTRQVCTTKDEALDFTERFIMPHPWFRAICIEDRPVGSLAIGPAPGDEKHRAWIGYSLAYDYWGRGIATAAVKKAVAIIFKEWPHLERIEAVADVENRRSQRVLEKAGFQREAVLRKFIVIKDKVRDVVMYSFLSTDPLVE